MRKNFQEIRRVMHKHIPMHTIKITDIEFEKALVNKLEDDIKAKIAAQMVNIDKKGEV